MKIEISSKTDPNARRPNSFVMIVDGVEYDGMAWDEMLGFIALKTLPPHRKAGDSLYEPNPPSLKGRALPKDPPGNLEIFDREGALVYAEQWIPTGRFRIRAGWFWPRIEQQEQRHVGTKRLDGSAEEPAILMKVSEFRWRNSPAGTAVMLSAQPEKSP